MITIKPIAIIYDHWNAPRPIRLMPSMTAAQILRQVGLDPTGALLHERTTAGPISSASVQHSWMGRDRPYKLVNTGDVLRAIQFSPNNANKNNHVLPACHNPGV